MIHWGIRSVLGQVIIQFFLEILSLIDKKLFNALWKSKCPRRVNILVWIMLNGNLDSADVLQKKLPNQLLCPSICPLCCDVGESMNHIFFLMFLCSMFEAVVWFFSRCNGCFPIMWGIMSFKFLSVHLWRPRPIFYWPMRLKGCPLWFMVREKSTYFSEYLFTTFGSLEIIFLEFGIKALCRLLNSR